MRYLSVIKNSRYDFISCLEALYYISDSEEREKVLINIRNKGRLNCVCVFSVVTTGANQYRRYFIFEKELGLFRKHFNVIHNIPISHSSTNLIIRLLIKLRLYPKPDIRKCQIKLSQKMLIKIALFSQIK